jgi:D-alanyl-D-alanine carboxypeptidase/D-alanyl-D-alanine carboxypeptidase (penicillin-binding protein 5/6)
MNKKALELGATGTNFANPCGAHNSNHYSSVRDFAKISQYAMTLPKFREIAGKNSYTLPPTNKHQTWGYLPVTNKLFNYKSNYYTKVTGIKTGSTGQAGNNLVASALGKDGTELISVIFGVKEPGSEKNIFVYTRELLEYGFKNFSTQRLADEGRVEKTVNVVDAKDSSSLDIIVKNSIDAVLPNDKSSWNIETSIQINPEIKAPVSQGQTLGYIEYKRNGVLIGKSELIASKQIEQNVKSSAIKTVKSTIQSSLIIKIILGIASLLAILIVLRLTLRRISRNKRK